MAVSSIDAALVERTLTGFIREEMASAGFQRAVVGLSGGVDSAVSCTLAARALGPDEVLALALPYRESSPDSVTDARTVAATLKVRFEVLDITPQIDAYFATQPDADPVRRGNKLARERMSILYDRSASFRALVIGTSNKSELLLGYGTLHGDIACAINPLGDLYKTQVYELARHLGLPAAVLDKPPSADLWAGQSDEEELGFAYWQVDALLEELFEGSARDDLRARWEQSPQLLERVRNLVTANQFKRRLPLIAKLGNRTIHQDRRLPRD